MTLPPLLWVVLFPCFDWSHDTIPVKDVLFVLYTLYVVDICVCKMKIVAYTKRRVKTV